MRNPVLKRRSFLAGSAAACLGGGWYGLGIEPDRIVVETRVFPVTKLPEAFEGFRIVALSDFHLYPFTKLEFLKRAVEIARALKPDLLVFLGDFIDGTVDAIFELAPVLATADAKHGLMAVPGNHDAKKGPGAVAKELRQQGIEVLLNRHVDITMGASALRIVGVDSFFGRQDLGILRAPKPEGCPSVLLAHEPDIADAVNHIGGVHVQLSGHSHGGQVRIPGMSPVGLPRLGKKYPLGTYQVGEMWLHTSRGLGTTGIPVRIGSVPEVTEVVLHSA